MNNMNDKKCKTCGKIDCMTDHTRECGMCGGILASTEKCFHRDCQRNAWGDTDEDREENYQNVISDIKKRFE